MEGKIKERIKEGRRLVSNRIDSRKLNRGDHIYVYRGIATYAHHGIYLEGEHQDVIHFTPTGETSNNVKGKSEQPCTKCGYDSSKNRGVVKTCLDCFVSEGKLLGGHSVYLYDYGVSKRHYKLQRAGTCWTTPSSRTPDEVVETDMKLYENNNFGEYDLVQNNCESFATFCKTGTKFSAQVEKKLTRKTLAQSLCAFAEGMSNNQIDQK